MMSANDKQQLQDELNQGIIDELAGRIHKAIARMAPSMSDAGVNWLTDLVIDRVTNDIGTHDLGAVDAQGAIRKYANPAEAKKALGM